MDLVIFIMAYVAIVMFLLGLFRRIHQWDVDIHRIIELENQRKNNNTNS